MTEFETIDLKQYKDIPCTIIGSTHIPESFVVTLTAEGIKAIAKKMKKNDCLRIEMFNGYKATEFKIIREVTE
jgi:hypothetical protein